MYLPAEDFDFVKLLGLGRENAGRNPRSARVAVLGFATTTYYTTVLRGLGEAVGFPIVTYESEYNTVEQTVLDEGSPLYSFRPDFIVFVTAVQALRDRLLSEDLMVRDEIADREAEHLASLIEHVSSVTRASVVVNELVLPYERACGNFSTRVPGSLPSVTRRINERLRAVARTLASVYTIDCDHIASWIGKQAWFDERLWFHSKSFCHPEALPHVAGQAIDIFRAVRGRVAKCVAVDLDNTLWGGVIGEDGLEGIRLGDLGDGEAYSHFQRWLKELQHRGVILAICSKNDEARAYEALRRHPDMVLGEADFAALLVNWDDKAHNLRLLSERLGIGLDSVVFLDDSPFERNLVRTLVPDVCVPELPEDPSDFVPYLEACNLFEVTQFSDEDRRRTDFYKANGLRQAEQTRFSDVTDYLASLEMRAGFERFDDNHLPRIAQLVQKTNQFNLTTIRHTSAELAEFADNPDYFPFYVTLEDRFGDNGLISVVIGRRDGKRMEITTWLMSCRVISRRVEEFVLDRLVEVAREAGIPELWGRYVPTVKNGIVEDHYVNLGFTLAQRDDVGCTEWKLETSDAVPRAAPIRLKTHEP